MGFKCNECGDEFKCTTDLGEHLVHYEGFADWTEDGEGDYIYVCEKCGDVYEDEGDMHMHLIFGEKLGSLTGKDKEEQENFEKNPPEEFRPLMEEIRKQKELNV